MSPPGLLDDPSVDREKFVRFFAAPKFPDEAKNLRARLLHGFLTTALVVGDILIGSFILYMPQMLTRWLVVLAAANVFGALLLFLLNRRAVAAVGWLTLLAFWSAITILAATAGGIEAPVVMLFPSLILLAGLMFGTRGGLAAALLCSASGLVLVLLGNAGNLPAAWTPYPPLAFWVVSSIAGFLVTILQDQASRIIQRAREQTGESDRRLSALMANLQGIVYRCRNDSAWTMEFISEACLDITGYAPEDLIGNRKVAYSELILPEDREQVRRDVQRAVSQQETFHVSYRIRTADGRIKWIWEQGRGIFDERNGLAALEGYISDVTSQRQAEAALQESEEDFRLLVETAPDAIFIQIRMRFAYVNPSAASLLGASDSAVLVGQPVEDRFPPDLHAAMLHQYRRLVEERVAIPSLDQVFLTLDGSRLDVEVSAVPCRYRGEDAAIVFMRNISARKKSEEALRLRAQQLSLLNRISAQIGSVLDVTELLARTARLVHESFHYHHVGIFLVEESTGDLVMAAKAGLFAERFPEGHRLHADQGMVGWAARHGKRRLADDVENDRYFVNPQPDRIPTRSELCMPIQYSGQTLGVLDIQSPTPRDFDENDLLVMETLSRQVGVALETARLYQSAQQELAVRRRAEELLRESEDRYRQFVANTADGIWRLEPREPIDLRLPEEEQLARIRESRVAECNNSMARMLGFERGTEAIGRAFSETTAAQEPGSEESLRGLIRKQYRLADVELCLPDAQGSNRWFEWSMVGFMDRNAVQRIWGVRVDVTRRKQQELELEQIASFSEAVRNATTRAEMLPVIAAQIHAILNSQNLTLETIDPLSGEVVVELAQGDWAPLVGTRIPASEGLNAVIRSTRRPFLDNDAGVNRQIFRPDMLGGCRSVAGAPLIARDQITGFIWVARAAPIREDSLRLLVSLADIAANALSRAGLFDRVERNLQRMAALHEIDSAISGTLNLQVSLSILVGHMIRQMNLNAADVLVFNPAMQSLEFAAGQGFRFTDPERVRYRMGEGLAGRAALERTMVRIPDLSRTAAEPAVERLQREEGFVGYIAVPLLAKGQVQGVIEVYHRAPFSADQEWLDFLETIAGQAAIAIDNHRLLSELQHANVDLHMAYDETIEGWSHALDLRDKETEGHTQRVTAMTLRMAEEMNISESDIVHIRRGALLHDIGKMGVPDSILLKPGALTPEEVEIIRRHPMHAYELLAPIRYLRRATDIPYCHHEKWNGTGYPRGLKGDAIPLPARLFAIVDVWDAITSHRPYNDGMTFEKAVEYIHSESGAHFEPRVVDVFLSLVNAGDPVLCQVFQGKQPPAA